MDLRKYHPTAEQIQTLIGLGCYQPFIFSDTFMSGICYFWITGEPILAMDKENDRAYKLISLNQPLEQINHYITEENWKLFVECNTKLRNMYDSWIDYTLRMLVNPFQYSVLDTASNGGYFLFQFKERGAGSCIGYDLSDFSGVYSTLNELTGHDIQFIHKPYNMVTHTIPGSSPADIVISTAIMCHLSDPLHHLAYLGSMTKKALLLFTTVDDTDIYQITYDGAKVYYPNMPFPNCFDANTRISKGLLLFGLRELGFSEIIEIPHSDSWIPAEIYKNLKTIIAMKKQDN